MPLVISADEPNSVCRGLRMGEFGQMFLTKYRNPTAIFLMLADCASDKGELLIALHLDS